MPAQARRRDQIMEFALASLVTLLCFSAVMFAAGYLWRVLEEGRKPPRSGERPALQVRERAWDGMIGKI